MWWLLSSFQRLTNPGLLTWLLLSIVNVHWVHMEGRWLLNVRLYVTILSFTHDVLTGLYYSKAWLSLSTPPTRTGLTNPACAALHKFAFTLLEHCLNCGSDRWSMSLSRTLLLSLRKCMQPTTHTWAATIERLNLCRRPTRRGTKAGTRRFKPITRVASRLCQEVSSVDKQTGVNNANLIQLTSRGTGDGTLMARSSPDLRAKFALINARSIRNKALLVRDYIDEHELDVVAMTETWLGEDEPTVVSELCRDDFSFAHTWEQVPGCVPSHAERSGTGSLLYRTQYMWLY